LLYGTSIPPGSVVPYPDADRNGTPDTTYGCFNCHSTSFTPVRDCTVCHTASAHHVTPDAMNGDCVSCHGDVIDNPDDGHYIPTYSPSLVTPSSRGGDGLPLNSRGKGAGACNYCHDDDGLAQPLIRNMADLHHGTSSLTDCLRCHGIQDPLNIRVCESCHGPDSLHNIQADSPAAGNIGTIVVGGEDAGYGHVGKDAGPGNSDCWGCHGFAFASAPRSGPVIPTLYNSDLAVLRAGRNTMVVLSGTAFRSTIGSTLYESEVRLTGANGSSVTLEPDLIIDEGSLAVTIPGDTPPGNYSLRATKADFASNPAVVSVVPAVRISRVVYRGRITISGSGFGAYAKGSSTSVTGTITSGSGRRAVTKSVTANIISWTDTQIVADFGLLPKEVTVNSIFGRAKAGVVRR
jgi:hypothetical protein